jgi:GDP-4-dehydro-6-deoxy-D-mannose reductase
MPPITASTLTRAFITGHTGFTGQHLVAHLRQHGYETYGYGRTSGGDIRDTSRLAAAIADAQPNVVFHLAAERKTRDPRELYSVAVLGTVALLDAILAAEISPVVLIVSSSAVYGRGPEGRRLHELVVPKPVTHHGASKLAQEQVALRYVRAHGLHIIRARTFNLLGPGLPADLACGAFTDSIVRCERGLSDPVLRTGNLRSWRDFTDVRDAVAAYRLLAQSAHTGSVYNVCSSQAVSLEACVTTLLEHATVPMRTELDPERLQMNDVEIQVGDGRRLTNLTGWHAEIGVEQSLADMLSYRRAES